MPEVRLEPMYTEHGWYVRVNGKIIGLVWKADFLVVLNKNKNNKLEDPCCLN